MTESKPSRKKKPRKMTNEEIAKRVFPPEVIEHLNRVAETGKASPQEKNTE